MTLAEQYTVGTEVTFRQRVQVAMVTRTLTALAANPDSPTLALGRDILRDPDGYAVLVALATATHSTIASKPNATSTITDSEVQTAVNAVLAQFVR